MPYKTVSGARKSIPSLKSLSDSQVKKFIKVFNSLVKQGKAEGDAIPLAIAQAKKGVKSNMKVEKSSMMKMFSDFLDSHLSNQPEQTQVEKTANEDMVSYEVVYEPDVKDAHGQWMSADTIEKGCENFNKNLTDGNIIPNLFHMQDTDVYEIEKSWVQPELDLTVTQTGEDIKAGTWVAKVRYLDDNIWELKKAEVIQGLSMQCVGSVNEETGEITNLSFDPQEEEE